MEIQTLFFRSIPNIARRTSGATSLLRNICRLAMAIGSGISDTSPRKGISSTLERDNSEAHCWNRDYRRIRSCPGATPAGTVPFDKPASRHLPRHTAPFLVLYNQGLLALQHLKLILCVLISEFSTRNRAVHAASSNTSRRPRCLQRTPVGHASQPDASSAVIAIESEVLGNSWVADGREECDLGCVDGASRR